MADDNKDSVGSPDLTTQRAQAVLRLRELAALDEIPAPALLADLFPAAGTSLQEAIELDAGAEAAAQTRREADAAARRAAAHESAVTEPASDYVFPSREHAEAAITQRFGMLNDSGALSVWDSQTKSGLSIAGFNAEWRRHMPEEPWGGGRTKTTNRPLPFDILKYSPDRHTCRGVLYEPGEQPFFKLAGVEYANSYGGHPTDERPTIGDPEARRAARTLVKFARHLFPRHKFGPHLDKIAFLAQLLDMHAYLYMNPDSRACFCMVLGGAVEGCGKTMLTKRVTGAIHGHRNQFVVKKQQLFSNFNSYEEKHRFGVMDELQIQGAEGRARLDGIKTSISEPDLRVVAKGKDGRTVANHVTWLATTNFPLDAIPVTESARRWWLEDTPAGRVPRPLARKLAGLLARPTSKRAAGIGGAVLRAYLRARYERPGFDFDPWAEPPDNEALRAAKRASIPREQELLEDALEPGGGLSHGFGTVQDIESAVTLPGHRIDHREHPNGISRERWWQLFEAAAKAKGLTVTERLQPRALKRASYRLWYRDDAELRVVYERFKKVKEAAERGAPK
jgi:hypothetical protein